MFAGAVKETVVAATTATFTLAVAEVAVVPFESVTRAVKAKMPEVVGVQFVEYGAVSAVPTTVVPTRKSTLLTVAPPTALAVALIELRLPRAIEAPFVGDVSATVGVVDATTTLTEGDITVAEFESVTRAVTTNEPAVAGVHEAEYGVVSAEPTSTGLVVAFEGATKKSTRETVAGDVAKAAAVSETAEPITTVEPAEGEVTEIVGAVTFTFTALEVTTAPVESVTRAVRATTPEADGDQVMEYGAVKVVPMTAVPARNSTRVTVAAPGAVAVAVRLTEVPSATELPVVGAVRVMVGADDTGTTTFTTDEVTVVPLESVTRAVRAKTPDAEGDHVTE